MSNTGVERDEDGLTYEEQRKEAERWYQALKVENERLREALQGMLVYASYNETWQDDHPEYIEKAKQILGEEDSSPFVLNKLNKSNDDFNEYVIETVTTGGEG